jgi:hypothetical protein
MHIAMHMRKGYRQLQRACTSCRCVAPCDLSPAAVAILDGSTAARQKQATIVQAQNQTRPALPDPDANGTYEIVLRLEVCKDRMRERVSGQALACRRL